jgi:serine O-acetyltransferase
MDKSFLQELVERHKVHSKIASSEETRKWVITTIGVLFSAGPSHYRSNMEEIGDALGDQQTKLVRILRTMGANLEESPTAIAAAFFKRLPEVYRMLK